MRDLAKFMECLRIVIVLVSVLYGLRSHSHSLADLWRSLGARPRRGSEDLRLLEILLAERMGASFQQMFLICS